MAKSRRSKGFIGRIFGMLFSVPGLVLIAIGAFAISFIGGKPQEMISGLAEKAKGLIGGNKG